MNTVALGEEAIEKSMHDPEVLEKHQGEKEFHNRKTGTRNRGLSVQDPLDSDYRCLPLCEGVLMMGSIRYRINYDLIIVKSFFDFPKIKL
jgi:hypothetical protein